LLSVINDKTAPVSGKQLLRFNMAGQDPSGAFVK